MAAIFTSEIDVLSALFSALSDPTRRAMLQRLSQGEASVNELAAPFNMSLPAVSKHIKVLEKAGLLSKTISAQQRPCKLEAAGLKSAADWLQLFAINNIAEKAINTPAKSKNIAKNTSKKQVKAVVAPVNTLQESESKSKFKPKFKLKITKPDATTKENTNDTDSNNIQQQIGFDF